MRASSTSFDRKSPVVPAAELKSRLQRGLPPAFRKAVETASKNIRRSRQLQLPAEQTRVDLRPGIRVGQIVRPLDTVAAYIPAGRYPLPSTLMMTVIPAQVAGVPNICVTSPRPVAGILGTAQLLGVSQRVSAGRRARHRRVCLRHEDGPRADRIVGPGNIYVAAAKKLLAGEVGIDFIAGPTEILIIAAEGEPAWIAADMLAQAEHDVDASAILLTTSKRLATAVAKEIERQLATLPTAAVARKVDRREQRDHSRAIARRSRRNQQPLRAGAPQHSGREPARPGSGTPAAFSSARQPGSGGRLCVRPESCAADLGCGAPARRTFGGRLREGDLRAGSQRGALRRLAPAITTLARAEGLEAHARSRGGRASMSKRPRPREAVLRDGAVLAADRRARGQAAARLQREHGRLLAESHRVPAAAARSRAGSPSIPNTSKRSAISRHTSACAESEMLLTNGTDEAIQVLINTYVDDDDEVIILRPSYAMYTFYAEVAGAQIREIDYRAGDARVPARGTARRDSPATRARS